MRIVEPPLIAMDRVAVPDPKRPVGLRVSGRAQVSRPVVPPNA